MRSITTLVAALALVCFAGCKVSRKPAASSGAIDSALPRGVALQRFQEAVPQVDTLATPFRSRDSLVAAFVAGVERNDTASLRRMALTASEFGWLYYPTTPQGLPPYSLNADLMWFLTYERSGIGLARMLTLRGGQSLNYVGYECEERASKEGINTVWGPCQIRRRGPDGKVFTERLFGLIIEREGRYKFVSFANQFD